MELFEPDSRELVESNTDPSLSDSSSKENEVSHNTGAIDDKNSVQAQDHMVLVSGPINEEGEVTMSSDGYACPYCDVVAKSTQGFKKHAASAHANESYFICSDCTVVAKSESGLQKHRQAKH
jgi:hypothetical protein